MATKKRILEGLTASSAPSDSAYKKAMTALEKSTIAFDKAVDGVFWKGFIGITHFIFLPSETTTENCNQH